MHHNRKKQQIVLDNPELVLCENGDFKIKADLVEQYEIIEKHHNRKLDVPSGTALLLADSIRSVKDECEYNIGRHENGKRTKTEIGIHAVRMGNEVGTHEVIFATNSQVITLKHEAENRGLFAEGAVTAAEFLIGKEAGYYNMDDILE